MSTNSSRRTQIATGLKDKEYRDLFVAEHIDTGVSFQIRAMRQDRGWSQRGLAEHVGMAQEGVSRLENPDYGKLTLTTLKRLASAFDVALEVRFVPFSRLVDWSTNLSPQDLTVPDFEHDPGFEYVSDYLPVAETTASMPPIIETGTPETSVLDTPVGVLGALRKVAGTAVDSFRYISTPTSVTKGA